MTDEIIYPCLMQAVRSTTVIVKMVSYGEGTVVGTGNGFSSEKYAIGYHCTTWQMDRFTPFKG